jgi:hypothetical protein
VEELPPSFLREFRPRLRQVFSRRRRKNLRSRLQVVAERRLQKPSRALALDGMNLLPNCRMLPRFLQKC